MKEVNGPNPHEGKQMGVKDVDEASEREEIYLGNFRNPKGEGSGRMYGFQTIYFEGTAKGGHYRGRGGTFKRGMGEIKTDINRAK